MSEALSDLMALLPPPGAVRSVGDWTSTEASLGGAVPEDFKAFCATWGRGSIASANSMGSFLGLSCPVAGDGPDQFVRDAREFFSAYRTLADHRPDRYPVPLYPAIGSFLPFGRTDNGDHLGWIVTDSAPETWTVAIIEDEEGRAQKFDVGFAVFMLGLARGDIRPAAFPDSFFKYPLEFHPSSRQ